MSFRQQRQPLYGKRLKAKEVPQNFSIMLSPNLSPLFSVGNGYSANPLFQIESRAVSGKIEKVTRFGEPGQFLSPPLGFQFVQDQCPDIIHIDPGPKDGKDIRVFQLRDRFLYLESTYSHF